MRLTWFAKASGWLNAREGSCSIKASETSCISSLARTLLYLQDCAEPVVMSGVPPFPLQVAYSAKTKKASVG
jgi:hypothetical protein